MWRLPLALILTSMVPPSDGGFGNPHEVREILAKRMERPCACGGETYKVLPFRGQPISQSDCGTKTAYNFIDTSGSLSSMSNKKKCCFYAKKSEIVQDKIKRLQKDLKKKQRDLQDSPLWTGLHGLLPYFLPLLGPIFLLILILTVGPCVFNKITQFIHQRLEAIKVNHVEVYYQRLATQESGLAYDWLSFYERPSSALHLTNDG